MKHQSNLVNKLYYVFQVKEPREGSEIYPSQYFAVSKDYQDFIGMSVLVAVYTRSFRAHLYAKKANLLLLKRQRRGESLW